MSMTQLVIGATLGFLIAQGVLHGMRQFLAWAQRDSVRARVRAFTPAPATALISGFIKYAGPVGASAALILLGVWGVGDYLAAKSARAAAMTNFDDPAAADAPTDPRNAADEHSVLAAAPTLEPSPPAGSEALDPYRDQDFKVQRRSHRGGGEQSLKESLLQRAETKARNELLLQMKQHAQRSQYDCEAAAHADKYLKAGLDVWGFTAWQEKYYPTTGYTGATLAQCKDIKNVLDPAALDLRSTVAQK
jgi:hypothetical protein